jgi:hypothetical protein
MIGDELKFSLEEVYVPLGLVERQRVTVFDGRSDRLDESEVIGDNFIPDLDRFLAQLVTNSVPSRIGIIGEPGSRKTTCLQRLAAKLLIGEACQNEHRQLLPIWISLADLQGETLENYLLQDWLKTATKQITVDPQLQQDLVTQFNRGRVWLLLDAVDEIAIDPSIAMANLARQLRGWVGTAHIILTCRSNIWDSGKNALENFRTYRNLSLSNGSNHSQNQIQQFIQGWFKARPNLGDRLDRLSIELAQPQYQRLRDAIKNPLRLALLCRSWSLAQGKLPSTKSSLYQQFTDAIYAWKQDRFSTTLAQRQQLDRALAKLAINAIELDRVRFRISHHLVLEILTPDLLELALQLGWLNRVGISATTGANIYQFYPSPIQEGARLALRQTDRVAAIAGLENFVRFSFRDATRTVENPFLIWQAAHSLGKVFDPGNLIAIQALVNSLELVDYSDLLIKICESLVKIDPHPNLKAIAKLVDTIHNASRESMRRKAAFTLGKLRLEKPQLDENNSLLTLVIDTLIRTIESGQDRSNRLAASENLHQIAPTHPTARQQVISDAPHRLLDDRTFPSSTRNRRKKVARTQNIDIAIAELEQKLTNFKNAESQCRYAYQLGKFQPGHPIAVNALLKLMSVDRPSSFHRRTGEYLREIVLDEQLSLIVTILKHHETDAEAGDRSTLALKCYKLLWYCAEQLPYPKFNQIWLE